MKNAPYIFILCIWCWIFGYGIGWTLNDMQYTNQTKLIDPTLKINCTDSKCDTIYSYKIK
jgi:hypothetical protein